MRALLVKYEDDYNRTTPEADSVPAPDAGTPSDWYPAAALADIVGAMVGL